MAPVESRGTLEIVRERKRSARDAFADKWVRLAAAASVVLLAVIAAGVWSLGGSKSSTPRFVALQSAQSATTQVATVALIGDKTWVISGDMPANDTTSSQYVLWVLPVNGSPVPVGSFDVAPGHPASAIGKVPQSLSSVKAFAVSKEPGRTLPTKPTVVVASGPLT
jgi:anti-sigma-K factor RskA